MATSNDPLDLVNPSTLRKIDALFECNVGHHIHLPQLVVVGNQSSGKSSVLEGISKLPFPKDSGLCTQFATQIVFRRSEAKHTFVKIIPAQGASDEHKAKCKAWTANWDDQDPQSFVRIMNEAKQVMDIRVDTSAELSVSFDHNASGGFKTFSEDVLKLEVLGPDKGHFSIIDVPGIFKVATEGKTTRKDVELVRRMVEGYVSNPRSIILAVVPANVDLATEEILNIAETHDPEGTRTIGILTKPDLIDKGAERGVLDVLQGKQHKLHHGWCIVKNLGQKELQDFADRDKVEHRFFDTEVPWKTVAKKKVGIASLRDRLQKLIREHTEREFPAVKHELEEMLRANKAEVEDLGPVRSSGAEQASYLIGIATHFQDMTKKAKAAHYSSDKFFDDRQMRLATKIANRGDSFRKLFVEYGHTHDFDPVPGENGFGRQDSVMSDIDEGEPKPSRLCQDLQGIKDVLDPNVKLQPPIQGGIMDWLEEVYDDARGLELVSDAKLPTTMKEQSEKWDPICHGYISDVIVMVHKFVLKLLQHVCPDEHVRRSLMARLEERIKIGYQKARYNVEFNLDVELKKTPMTQNEKFNDLLQEYRANRLIHQLQHKAFTPHNMETKAEAVWVKDISKSLKSMSNREYMVQQMHDTLKAYYEIARPRAVDAIIKQGMESFLLSGDGTPLDILNPHWVSTLALEELESIAGEDAITRSKREELIKAIADLEKGKKILKSP